MSMLLKFDPFRDFDRMFDQAIGNGLTRRPSFPMDAYRRGDAFIVHFDLPGVDPDSIDLEVERNVLTVTAQRRWEPQEGDDVIANERVQGSFRRQLLLGDSLNSDAIAANYENGVLTLTVPIAEKAKPRKVEIQRQGSKQAIEASTSSN